MAPISLQMPREKNWAVGVSGGADSVALLLLLHERPGLRLRVVHLDHELRGEASVADARFVQTLAGRFGLPIHVGRRTEVEPSLRKLPANPSARYRAIRLEYFRRVVLEQDLDGVMLAHHADDVAETALHRLIRGAGPAGVAAMQADRVINRLRVVRPLLGARRNELRAMLAGRRQEWREDASNQSDLYLRNQLRKILGTRESLTCALLELAASCRVLAEWTQCAAPQLEASFAAPALVNLTPLLARQSAREWLINAGCPPAALSTATLDRLILMAADAATPAVDEFPGNVTIRRRRGVIGTID